MLMKWLSVKLKIKVSDKISVLFVQRWKTLRYDATVGGGNTSKNNCKKWWR